MSVLFLLELELGAKTIVGESESSMRNSDLSEPWGKPLQFPLRAYDKTTLV